MSEIAMSAAEQEVDAVLAFAGLVVPADLKAGVVAEIMDLRRATALLRQPRPAANEPANVFRLQPEK